MFAFSLRCIPESLDLRIMTCWKYMENPTHRRPRQTDTRSKEVELNKRQCTQCNALLMTPFSAFWLCRLSFLLWYTTWTLLSNVSKRTKYKKICLCKVCQMSHYAGMIVQSISWQSYNSELSSSFESRPLLCLPSISWSSAYSSHSRACLKSLAVFTPCNSRRTFCGSTLSSEQRKEFCFVFCLSLFLFVSDFKLTQRTWLILQQPWSIKCHSMPNRFSKNWRIRRRHC